MKRFLQIALLLATGLSLSACGNLKILILPITLLLLQQRKKVIKLPVLVKMGIMFFLKDGEYVTSPIEGTTENTSDNNVDSRALESGLIDLSHNTFSSSKYVFQEGQKFRLLMLLIG